ncbi:hypothetical protein QPK31_18090 [Massilia sp. YIM B02769]|uniref:hypothetical protein n=1 Tax=Massilia sp. YIM B02769 TaxID=3050129 RepID=UPI0025B6377A|nr:hypothetical protein [Massilia sp. YIM B02769]MDN4060121.1 hypothetical protein [Massilia sp. YIM B02769]
MEPEQLPIWTEYVRVLGTPVVALLAASIAGFIANRQWKTARNKLKLDLFDKRIAIYKLAITALQNIRTNKVDVKAVEELENSLHAARWLFNIDVALYLHELALRVYKTDRPSIDTNANMTETEFAEALIEREKHEATYQQERSALDAVLSKFLALEH